MEIKITPLRELAKSGKHESLRDRARRIQAENENKVTVLSFNSSI